MIQVSKRNPARLHYLAHLIAESLVAIAENMEGKWGDVPAALKTRLDEYEVWVLPLTFMINSSYLNHRILNNMFKGCEMTDVFISCHIVLQCRRS